METPTVAKPVLHKRFRELDKFLSVFKIMTVIRLLDFYHQKVVVVGSPSVNYDVWEYSVVPNIRRDSKTLDLMSITVVFDIHVPALEFLLNIDREMVSDGSLVGINIQQVPVLFQQFFDSPANSALDVATGEG